MSCVGLPSKIAHTAPIITVTYKSETLVTYLLAPGRVDLTRYNWRRRLRLKDVTERATLFTTRPTVDLFITIIKYK